MKAGRSYFFITKKSDLLFRCGSSLSHNYDLKKIPQWIETSAFLLNRRIRMQALHAPGGGSSAISFVLDQF